MADGIANGEPLGMRHERKVRDTNSAATDAGRGKQRAPARVRRAFSRRTGHAGPTRLGLHPRHVRRILHHRRPRPPRVDLGRRGDSLLRVRRLAVGGCQFASGVERSLVTVLTSDLCPPTSDFRPLSSSRFGNRILLSSRRCVFVVAPFRQNGHPLIIIAASRKTTSPSSNPPSRRCRPTPCRNKRRPGRRKMSRKQRMDASRRESGRVSKASKNMGVHSRFNQEGVNG